MLQFCQKCSPSVVCRSSIPLLRLFSSSFEINGGNCDDKRKRKWEPRDHLSVKEKMSEGVHNPLPQKTKSLEQKKIYYGNEKQRAGNTAKMKDSKFETQLEVDAFIQTNLQSSNNRSISDLLRISAKVSKRNKRVSFLKKHLPAIVTQLKELSSSIWTFQDISGVIYGLQYMTVNEVGVKNILSIMTTVAAKSLLDVKITQSLQGQHIAMLLYGLQMTASCGNQFKAQEVGNALYGLKGMSSDCGEVRDLLSALTIKVSSCKEDLDAQAVGNALYGLQGMSSECSEVRNMISALSLKIHTCKEDLNAQAVGNALCGMLAVSWIGDSPYYNSLIAFMTRQINILVDNISNDHSLDSSCIGTKDLVTLCQSFTFFIPVISSFTDKKVCKNLEKMNVSIINELVWRRKNGDEYCNIVGYQSIEARKVHDICLDIFQERGIEVDSNVYLFDLFESDLVLYIPLIHKKLTLKNIKQIDTILNIEIDGIYSKSKKKLAFCRMKDACLKSKGVFVSRIDALRVSDMTVKEVKKWLLREVKGVYEQLELSREA
mmetsp:Transcript_8709/g.8639  ORF Transcript_8709/g.8639 Transcript_8709/m.8639 type:complete len:545 (+) Transcript_8709:268-1902(+)